MICLFYEALKLKKIVYNLRKSVLSAGEKSMILEVQYWKYESFQLNFVTTYCIDPLNNRTQL